MMYALKQVVGALATPLMIAVFICLTGCLLHWRRRIRVANALFATAIVVIYLSSIVPIGNLLLGPLERRYPQLEEKDALAGAAFIVVLGSGYGPREGVPVTGALDEDGLARVIEGIRLLRRATHAKLVLSGGAPPEHAPPAHGYHQMARELGVDEESLVVLDKPLDTVVEAHDVAGLVGNASFILVTSAFHMPRAMALMNRFGVHPIPAPTAQRVDVSSRGAVWSAFVPSSIGLRKTERALHEYVGLLAMGAGAL